MPKDIILIAAVTVDGFIARHAQEITSWSEDLHLFKAQTMGSPIIMGSNTHSTLSAALKGRRAIVIHRNDDPQTILSSIQDKRCFVIGGGKTYDRYKGVKELMPFAKAVSAKSHDFDDNGNEIHTDYHKMMKIVIDAGYRGYVGVEYEGSKLSEYDGIKATKKLLESVREKLS